MPGHSKKLVSTICIRRETPCDIPQNSVDIPAEFGFIDIVPSIRRIHPNRREQLEGELDRIISILKDMGALRIILFGSLADGSVGSFSDIDLIVVMDTDEPFVKRLDKVYKAVCPRVACDILLNNPGEFERMKKESSFVRRAISTGRVIYKAVSPRREDSSCRQKAP